MKASETMAAEVFVVDNHSTDGSVDYLAPKFPSVRFISSEVNGGFGKACNAGFKLATGEFTLFLNPDTIVAEDSFTNCIRFFETHPDCGALGVKMIDGSGRFLKESKRAFPSPLTSLFKLAGLSYLFPKSKLFSRYHLGYLDKEEHHVVDVLAGAFIMARRKVLEKVGCFDEDFFMYGEDVDLSYRIQKAGYKNYYFAGTTIIHFKGESTKRGSLNYVRMFYQAMMIFVNKHYGGARAGIFNLSIRTAIWIRAVISLLLKFVKWIGIPVIDTVIILFSFWAVKQLWSAYVRADIIYPNRLLYISLPVFTLLFLAAAYYAGLYDRHYKKGSVLRSTLVATITVLTVYALLPEHFRFSRGIVVFGALMSFLLMSLQRWLLIKAGIMLPPEDAYSKPHILIAAAKNEYEGIKNFLRDKGLDNRIIGRVGVNGRTDDEVSHLDAIEATTEATNAKELIFYAGTLSYKRIIALAETLRTPLKFRFHAGNSYSIIGSDTSTDSGEILSAEADFAIAHASNRRMKRLIDLTITLFFFLSFPFHFFFIKHPLHFFSNCFAVLFGKKTWIGYSAFHASLPRLRKSVLSPNGRKEGNAPLSAENLYSLHYWYARNYEPVQDVKTIFTHYKYLGG